MVDRDDISDLSFLRIRKEKEILSSALMRLRSPGADLNCTCSVFVSISAPFDSSPVMSRKVR